MEYANLLIETIDGVATLTLNNPKTLNALNSKILEELECALYELNRAADVKVIIITGAGKAFVAGADIREMAAFDSCQAHAFAVAGQRLMLFIEQMKKPVIAAVNGFALGGGLELALACDFIYASDNAKFGLPEVTLGVIPGFGGTQNLSRLIGGNRAKELIFTGRIITADKAVAWGIVNEIFTPEELMDKVREVAASIARNGMVAVGYGKDAVVNGCNMNKGDGFRYEASLFGVLFATEDQKEGMNAFSEKRKPEFQGK